MSDTPLSARLREAKAKAHSASVLSPDDFEALEAAIMIVENVEEKAGESKVPTCADHARIAEFYMKLMATLPPKP